MKTENFTNNREKYYQRIKSELASFSMEEGWKMQLIYIEMSQLLSHAYSMILENNPKRDRLRIKKYAIEEDRSTFSLGIYNLDRLTFKEKTYDLSNKDFDQLPLELTPFIGLLEIDGMVLDGFDCELHLASKAILKWNIDDEMNESLKKLVRSLRKTYLSL